MTSQKDEYFENKYYAYNLKFFKLIGIWSYDMSPKQLIYICFLNIMIAGGSILQIYLLFTLELKIVPIVKLMETILPTLCFAMCYYNILYNLTTMKRILCHIKCDWCKVVNESELLILKEYANRTKLYTLIIAIAFYLYSIFLISPSIISILLYSFDIANETELILPVYFNNLIRNRMDYYILFLLEWAFIFIISTIGVAHYSMFVLIVQHTFALFNIVASKIENAFDNNLYNFNNASNRSKFTHDYKLLVDIIECYDNAINFVDSMKSYLEQIYPPEVFLSLLFIILNYIYLFQLLTFTVNTSDGLQKINYIVGSTFVIYIYNYFGQKLIDYHTEIYIKLCQIPFYTLLLRTQKMLLFFIMKSTLSCNLSMKGIVVMSHDHFATLMRTSFSYALIFYNSMEDQQQKNIK